MANDFYQIYRQETTRLAETMVIKFDVSAVATNRYLEMVGIPSSDDRRTWRYYMNMAGLYHSTNRMMQVRSLDTGEVIDFTVENMGIHRATARGYAYGSKYYYDLLASHPKQESLILGILNPVDLEKAVTAPEGTILWMDSQLIESNEDNLVELLQTEITAYLDRWHVEMYSYTDDLYDAARIMVFSANLVNMIFSARLRNERTHRAHSFFIRQHLARYGRLDRFMDAMTKEQQLFFYRNAVHFHKYPGHYDSFEWLIDKVLADRNLPLAEHRLLQDEVWMPDNLVPHIELSRHEMTRQFVGVPDRRVQVDTVVDKQARLATFNAKVSDVNRSDTIGKMTLSKTNNVSTKVLESSVYDLKDSLSLKLEDMLISYWAYMASKGTYVAVTPFVDQRTGEIAQLAPKDAFIVFLYCYNKAHGMDLSHIPVITANHVLKSPLPTVQTLFDLTSKKYFTTKTAKVIRDLIPEVGTIISTESFYDNVYAVWSGALEQFNLASSTGHFIARGEIESMALHLFEDVGVDLADTPGQTTSQWLAVRGLEGIEKYSPFEADAAWPDLLSRATGLDLNTTLSLAYIHRAMIGVMERLSSYSVQFVREINDEPLKALSNKWVWPADAFGDAGGLGLVALPVVGAHVGPGAASKSTQVDILRSEIIARTSEGTGSHYQKVSLDIWSEGSTARTSDLILSTLQIEAPPPQEPHDLTGEEFESDFVPDPIRPEGLPIAIALVNRQLSGLNLPGADGLDVNKAIANKRLSGINPPDKPPVLDLAWAIPGPSLGGFDVELPDPSWIGHGLFVRELSGLNLPGIP